MEDEEVHSYINQLASSAGTCLYGRRMYETMVYWETAHAVPNQPQFVLEWARQWQAAKLRPGNFLGALSNSGPAVRQCSEGRAPAHRIKQDRTPRNAVMRRVKVLEFVSLDGVIPATGGAEEDNTKPSLWKSVVPTVLFIVVAISLLLASSIFAQQASQTSKFIRENSAVIALTHIQLIDGTGAAAQADRTIVIDLSCKLPQVIIQVNLQELAPLRWGHFVEHWMRLPGVVSSRIPVRL
jgi:hypothetical protein